MDAPTKHSNAQHSPSTSRQVGSGRRKRSQSVPSKTEKSGSPPIQEQTTSAYAFDLARVNQTTSRLKPSRATWFAVNMTLNDFRARYMTRTLLRIRFGDFKFPKATKAWRTAISGKWYLRAQLLDLKRKTALGTLGHLPLGIRQKIWRAVHLSEEYDSNATGWALLQEKSTWDETWFAQQRCWQKLWFRATNGWDNACSPAIENICNASRDIRPEVIRELHAVRPCFFQHPEHLLDFLPQIPHEVVDAGVKIEICLYGPYPIRDPRNGYAIELTQYGGLIRDPKGQTTRNGKWIEVLGTLPACVSAVCFVVGHHLANYKWSLVLLDVLNKRLHRVAPRIKRTCKTLWSDPKCGLPVISGAQCRVFGKIMRDVE